MYFGGGVIHPFKMCMNSTQVTFVLYTLTTFNFLVLLHRGELANQKASPRVMEWLLISPVRWNPILSFPPHEATSKKHALYPMVVVEQEASASLLLHNESPLTYASALA